MEQPLWAPWRMEYILSVKPEGCVFCDLPAESGEAADRRNLVVHRSAHSFSILNRYPYNPGHLLVVPRAHASALEELAAEPYRDLQEELSRALVVLKRALGPQGVNLGMNLGRAAGAGIDEHLHWHLVPRWNGDNNFMAVVADERVVPEALDRSWEKLRRAFAG